MSNPGFTAELPAQGEPEVGQELIEIRYDDGRRERLRLHDYGRLYSLPGLYEQIVRDRLGCRSPEQIASMLADAVDEIGWDRARVRVIDVAAGNGMSGEALVRRGLRPVLGTDIVPAARDAAMRDRPDVYDVYETLDLLALTPQQTRTITALNANALSCVAPVGNGSQQLPPLVLTAVIELLEADALIAYLHDPTQGVPDPITPELFDEQLGDGVRTRELERRRYVHRQTVGGRPYEMEGVILRVTRQDPRCGVA
jgi:hypothetical protein